MDCNREFAALPRFGVGFSYREELKPLLADLRDDIGYYEIVLEKIIQDPSYVKKNRDHLDGKAIAIHGVNMSLGSLDERIVPDMQRLNDVIREMNPIWISEHVAYTRSSRFDLANLLPTSQSATSKRNIVDKVRSVSSQIDVPFLLENISYYFALPGDDSSDSRFFSTVVNSTDAGILLDLNNLQINSENHSFDPYEWLADIDLDRVVQVHLSGGEPVDGFIYDNHGGDINEAVFELLDFVVPRAKNIKGIILERDRNFGDLDILCQSFYRAKSIFEKYTAAFVAP